VEFDALAAIIAGLIGGGVMATLLYMGIAMMPDKTRMNLFRLLGTMLLPAGGRGQSRKMLWCNTDGGE